MLAKGPHLETSTGRAMVLIFAIQYAGMAEGRSQSSVFQIYCYANHVQLNIRIYITNLCRDSVTAQVHVLTYSSSNEM